VGLAVSLTRQNFSSCGIDMVVSNYKVAFYVFAGCMLFCLVTTFFFKFEVCASYVTL